MERRLLATVAATACSVAALTAAVGATTHVFATGDAAAGVGTISPVSTSTLPPTVEHKVIDVDDPAPAAAPVPTPAAAPGPAPLPRHTPSRTPAGPTSLTTSAATAAATPAPTPPGTAAPRDVYEPGDD